LPIEIFEDLENEAHVHHISISDVVRNRFLQLQNFKNGISKPLPPSAAPSQASEIDHLACETILLLREFLFERHAQVLKKVDEKMEKRFGKDRRRVL